MIPATPGCLLISVRPFWSVPCTEYREGRFRHSNGIFPKKEPSTVHIKRRIAVKKLVEEVVRNLILKGFVFSDIQPGVCYLTPPLFSDKDILSETLIGLRDEVVWIESECLS